MCVFFKIYISTATNEQKHLASCISSRVGHCGICYSSALARKHPPPTPHPPSSIPNQSSNLRSDWSFKNSCLGFDHDNSFPNPRRALRGQSATCYHWSPLNVPHEGLSSNTTWGSTVRFGFGERGCFKTTQMKDNQEINLLALHIFELV